MRTAAFFLLMAILDYCVIGSARKILLDFLRGGEKKPAKRISERFLKTSAFARKRRCPM